ncbi:hypothetical protein FW778_14540 [Ginsengibacter hankyongi]|uniref:Uncharacterized protein n=1 Tax=Ginsengibacter hankyongi TaxID=2607284 RepID=A0A5J5IG45_9BACT|nr:hypothetical protein [Ginsengibacter hankyongi]KAA9037984.1 hypothetical protein FW778_14540 [Ginsengibacter hankyongi]
MLKVTFKSSILLIVFLITSNCYCQEGNRILIYSNKTDFLVPFIKSTLEEMVSNETGKKLFSRADNLNLLFVNTDADKLLRNNLNYNFPDQSFQSTRNTTLQDSIFNAFVSNDYFLLVNENTLQDKIEFQITLYKVIKDTPNEREKRNYFPIKNIITPLSENDFFIDITANNYPTILKNGVKRLFPESNFNTQFNLDVSGNVYPTSLANYSVSRNDTITLNVSDIYDEDTPVDQIKFLIEVKDELTNNNTSSFYIKTTGKQSKIVFRNSGHYKILVFADDGSNKTKTGKIIDISVVETPQLIAIKNQFNFVYPMSVVENNSIRIRVPVVVKNSNSVYPLNFVVLNQNKVEVSKKAFVDSIFNLLKKDKSRRINSNSRFRGHDSIYIAKVQRFDSNIYLIDIVLNSSNSDNLLYIYAIANNLKTNYEIINVKIIKESFFSNEVGIQHGSLKMGNTNCLCGNDSTEEINYIQLYPLSFYVNLYSYKALSVGCWQKGAFTLSQNITYGKNPILRSKNLFATIDVGFFASASFMVKSWYSNIRLKYYVRTTFNGFDSTYKDLKLYNLGYKGISLEADFFPIKHSIFGISFGVNVVKDKFKYLLFNEFGYHAGLVMHLQDL